MWLRRGITDDPNQYKNCCIYSCVHVQDFQKPTFDTWYEKVYREVIGTD